MMHTLDIQHTEIRLYSVAGCEHGPAIEPWDANAHIRITRLLNIALT
jgi:hypothetical protein